MSYEFQNILHRSAAAMAAAIAEEWLTAGGANTTAVIREEILPGATAESLADEAIEGWGLDQPDQEREGKTWMEARDTERADLVAAFEALIEQYSGPMPITHIEALEDNAGGLHLAIIRGDRCTHFFSGVFGEDGSPSLQEEIAGALADGVEDWSGNAPAPHAYYRSYADAVPQGVKMIAEWDEGDAAPTVYEQDMGIAGRRWARVQDEE